MSHMPLVPGKGGHWISGSAKVSNVPLPWRSLPRDIVIRERVAGLECSSVENTSGESPFSVRQGENTSWESPFKVRQGQIRQVKVHSVQRGGSKGRKCRTEATD